MRRAYYPICLNLEARPCVVVGGGRVAERKVSALLDCGAKVKVVSPTLTGALQRLVEGATIDHIARGYADGDLAGAFLAIAASDDRDVNTEVWREASRRGVLVNVADTPAQCDFITPSVLRRGGLTLAVSTGGASPALAGKIRTDLESRVGPEYSALVELLDRLRGSVMAAVGDPEARRALLSTVARDERTLDRLRAGESVDVILDELRKSCGLDDDDAGRGPRRRNS